MVDKPVVIVGGGPAGLAAAIELGPRCVLFEQDNLPHDKTCGGLLTPIAQEYLRQLGFADEDYPVRYNEVDLYFKDTQRTLTYRYPIIAALPRVMLSKFLTEKARQAGAEICAKTEVRSIDIENRVVYVGNYEAVPFDRLIVASGYGSPVDHALYHSFKKHTSGYPLYTLQYRLHNTGFERLATGWSTDFGPNYTWAMSLGKYGVHVGIVGPGGYPVLQPGLTAWLEKLNLPLPRREPDTGFVSTHPSPVCLSKDIFACGDVAGLALPMTGEGVLSAILSGRWSARRILNSSYTGRELEILKERQTVQHWLYGLRRKTVWQKRTNRLIDHLGSFGLGRQILAWVYGMSPRIPKGVLRRLEC